MRSLKVQTTHLSITTNSLSVRHEDKELCQFYPLQVLLAHYDVDGALVYFCIHAKTFSRVNIFLLSVFFSSLQMSFVNTISASTNSCTGSSDLLVVVTLSGDLGSRNTRYWVETVFYGLLGMLQCLVGAPTNAVNSLVFWRQGLRDGMNLCLFSLSLVDCSYFTLGFLMFPLPTFIRFYDLALYEEYFMKVTGALGGVLRGISLTSGCINMAVAVNTCVCIVYPHRAASLMRAKAMTSLIVVCFLLLQLFSVTLPLSYRVVRITTAGERLQWIQVYTQFYEENKLFIYLLQDITFGMILPLGNLIVMSVTVVVTVKTLHSAMTWRENKSHVSCKLHARQVALTRMLTIVTCVYIVTKSPSVVLGGSFGVVQAFLTDPTTLDNFMTVMAIMYVVCEVNGWCNFFIFYHRSSRFRRELHSMFRRARLRNRATAATCAQQTEEEQHG